jgi:predicted ATPase
LDNPLAVLLNEHLARRGWNPAQLARAAQIPRNTAYQWTKGKVHRVHQWQHVANAALVLGLSRDETDALLSAAGYPSLHVLALRSHEDSDLRLLAHWPPPTFIDTATASSNLPHPLTSFVGRAREQERITSLLTSTARLVTLTGAGGSGKSRLAIEAAFALRDLFDETWFVDLAPLHDAGQVIPTIAWAIGVRETTNLSAQRAIDRHLKDRKALLVLDNFEQVLEAGLAVAHMLARAGRISVLVTSRSRLNIRGEHVVSVPPLSLASPEANYEELAHNPAVVLFTDRAIAADETFTLTPHQAPLIAHLCARLDGLPLGLELVAVHVRSMSLPEMLRRFPNSLALANGGPHDAPDRHRTLRATIAWSVDLISLSARHLFAILGVFSNGFTEHMVAKVCESLGSTIDVSAGLSVLVDQHLLKRTQSDAHETHFDMLETIREYANELLLEYGLADEARRAHAAHYLAWVERADLQGNGQADWLHRLSADYDNLGAALAWCSDQEQVETGIRLCIALMPFWQLRDQRLVARDWLETFMAKADLVSPNLRAKGLFWHGLLLVRRTGDVVTASRLFDEALAVFRRDGDLPGAIEVLQGFGDAYRLTKEWDQALNHYRESLHLAEQVNDPYLIAHGHMGVALTNQELGHIETSGEHWERTLEWSRNAGNTATEMMALNSLGEMARYRSDWVRAERLYVQALELAARLGSTFWRALALHNLGYVALSHGEIDRAKSRLSESLVLYGALQYPKGEAECLAGLAKVEVSTGEPERAARLSGASEAILAGINSQLDAVDRADYGRTLALLHSQLGERLEELLDEGRRMSIEEAVSFATRM